MPRPVRAAGYGAILRLPGVPRAFAAASLARLSYATSSLSLLVTIQQATHSYATAGACLGVYALASIVMPVKSRLVDRRGQRRTLPLLSIGFTTTLVLMVLASSAGMSAASVYLTLSAVAGLAAAPLGPAMRALWSAVTPDTVARQRAYSLDGVVEEVLFMVGPLLVGGMLAFTSGSTTLAVTALLNLGGTIGMVSSPLSIAHAAPSRPPLPSGLLGPFQQRGFALLILIMLGIGLGGGPTEVAVLARTQATGDPAAAGYLLAVLAIGGAIGGLAWGSLRHPHKTSTQLGTLVVVMAAGGVGAAIAPTLIWLGVALLLTGLVSAPALIVAYLAVDGLVPTGGRTEATTWVNTSTNVGIALGVAGAGLIVDDAHAAAAFLAGAAALALTVVVVFAGNVVTRRAIHPRRQRSNRSVGEDTRRPQHPVRRHTPFCTS